MIDTNKYVLCGLNVHSELVLPKLASSVSEGEVAQINIRLADIPNHHFGRNVGHFSHELSPEVYYLYIEGTARYLISHGNDIVVDSLAEADERNVSLFLLGSAFGVLLHQRNLLPLHASTVKVGEHCIAFIGESGAGKSTLAALLDRSGLSVMGDDLCPVGINRSHEPETWASFPRIKLWSDVLGRLNYDPQTLTRDSVQDDKYHVPLQGDPVKECMPLTHIYLLGTTKNRLRTEIEEITGNRAMQALLNNVYRSELLTSEHHRERIFHQCATIVNGTTLFRLDRHMDLAEMDKVVADLYAHWACIGVENSVESGYRVNRRL